MTDLESSGSAPLDSESPRAFDRHRLESVATVMTLSEYTESAAAGLDLLALLNAHAKLTSEIERLRLGSASQRTPPPAVEKCVRCGMAIDEGAAKTFTVCDTCFGKDRVAPVAASSPEPAPATPLTLVDGLPVTIADELWMILQLIEANRGIGVAASTMSTNRLRAVIERLRASASSESPTGSDDWRVNHPAAETYQRTGDEINAVHRLATVERGEYLSPSHARFAIRCVEDLGQAEWKVRRDRDRLKAELRAALSLSRSPNTENPRDAQSTGEAP